MSLLSPSLAFLLLALTFPISVAVVCKCTGVHCASDVCQGDYCVAALIEAGSKAKKRWEEEPTQLYVRGCAFFTSYSLSSYADLMNSCFEYDETETESDKRKVCICSARLCNDGPLINASVNHFRQHTCHSDEICKGEYCLVHQPSPVRSASIHCANRTLPFFDHLLLGLSLSPALAPTILTFPGQLDRSMSLLLSEPTNETALGTSTERNDLIECPSMYLRIDHRDDPEICIPPKYGSCQGRLCIDIWFNATTFRGYVLERRYRGCIVEMTEDYRRHFGNEASSGSCVKFESPAVNVTACVSGVGICRVSRHVLFALILACCFLTYDMHVLTSWH